MASLSCKVLVPSGSKPDNTWSGAFQRLACPKRDLCNQNQTMTSLIIQLFQTGHGLAARSTMVWQRGLPFVTNLRTSANCNRFDDGDGSVLN